MNHLNNFKKNLICWGASDQCKVIKPIIEELGSKITVLVDDTPNLETPFPEIELLSGKKGLHDWLRGRCPSEIGFVIAIGNPYGFVRCQLHDYLKALGLEPLTLCDNSAIVDPYASVNEGTQIMRGVIVNADAKIGKQCILNTRSLIEHHDILEQGVEIGPGAILCGRVTVRSYSWICAGATIIPRITIGSNAIVGAGAVVIKHVPEGVIVTGIPASFLKQNELTNEEH
jgi:sugar O-acyltransferase (sialic acid O-acetyltransferase NeuD family)